MLEPVTYLMECKNCRRGSGASLMAMDDEHNLAWICARTHMHTHARARIPTEWKEAMGEFYTELREEAH